MHLRIHNVATRAAAEAMVIHYSSVAMPTPASASAAAASQSAPMDVNYINDEGNAYSSSMEHMSREELMERITAMSYRRPAPTTGLDARGAQGARGPPANVRTELPKYGNRTEAEMRKFLQERQCFECGETGHAARKCPTKLKSKN